MKNALRIMAMLVAVAGMTAVMAGCNCDEKKADETTDKATTEHPAPATPKDHPAH